MVCDLLLGTIDELRREIEMTKRNSEATITELKHQKTHLQEKLDSKIHGELSALKAENLRLKTELTAKISELDKFRSKLSSGQNKHVQTTEIINYPETKETQFMESISEFGWIEELLMENIADSERIYTHLSGKKCVDADLKQNS